MAKTDKFPWELLKAECLRLMCSQLVQASNEGHSSRALGRREEMLEFLRDVNERGLEPALNAVDLTKNARKPGETSHSQSPPKRKSARLEDNEAAEAEGDQDGYNTRYKGVKRVKIGQASPEPSDLPKARSPRKAGRPRKSIQGDSEAASPPKRGRGRPRKSAPDNEAEGKASTSTPRSTRQPRKSVTDKEDEEEQKPKRGRGRPRKSAAIEGTEEETGAPAPESKGKEVFDGVVLNKRSSSHKDQTANAEADAEDDEEGNGKEGEEEDAVLAAVNGRANVDASSLEGSNKENDPNDMVFQSGDNDADMDADGDADAEV